MNITMVEFFPRAHTAIAEWIACMIYILPNKKRFTGWKQWSLYLCFFVILLGLNLLSEHTVGFPWMLLMGLCMVFMLLMIFVCSSGSFVEAGYRWAHAFIAAEFAASLEWQINYYLIAGNTIENESKNTYLVMLAVYALSFGILYLLNRRQQGVNNRHTVSKKELVAAISISLVAFFISNFNFAFKDNVFTELLGAGVLYSRTLVDFGGLVMLYAHGESRKEMNLSLELEAMENLLNRQYEQYRMFEMNNKALHCIYHDLKHQIDFIRSEPNAGKRETYLKEMDLALNMHSADVKTGSSVVDTLLTNKSLMCVESDIVMTCYADARALEFVDVMDICSIFGNAIDNAIECVMKFEEKEKRLIKVDVYTQNKFVIIRVGNYCEDHIELNDGFPSTTKKENQHMHGFGVKSIKRAAEKYRGYMKLEQKDNWFTMTTLIPMQDGLK